MNALTIEFFHHGSGARPGHPAIWRIRPNQRDGVARANRDAHALSSAQRTRPRKTLAVHRYFRDLGRLGLELHDDQSRDRRWNQEPGYLCGSRLA